MLNTARRSDLQSMSGQIGQVFHQVVKVHFSGFCPTEAWSPAINAYHLQDHIEICVDLAGIDRDAIDLRIEPGRLSIRGVRQAPEPPHREGQSIQILAMEIDHGPFERTISLPQQVDVNKVSAEQTNGLLWIRLPLIHG